MKIFKKILIYGSVSILALTLVLIIHLAMVIKPVPNKSLQLARIDFKTALNQESSDEILKAIKNIEGVKFTHLNTQEGILVYSHDLNVSTGDAIYNNFTSQCSLPSVKFIAETNNAMAGCPINADNSFAGHFVSGIQSIFK